MTYCDYILRERHAVLAHMVLGPSGNMVGQIGARAACENNGPIQIYPRTMTLPGRLLYKLTCLSLFPQFELRCRPLIVPCETPFRATHKPTYTTNQPTHLTYTSMDTFISFEHLTCSEPCAPVLSSDTLSISPTDGSIPVDSDRVSADYGSFCTIA